MRRVLRSTNGRYSSLDVVFTAVEKRVDRSAIVAGLRVSVVAVEARAAG